MINQFGKVTASTRQSVFLLILIINSKANTLTSISKITDVSLNTILSDQKELNIKLEKFNLNILGKRYGHEIVGKEKNIRSLIQNEWRYLQQGYQMLLVSQKNISKDIAEIENYKAIISTWLEQLEPNDYFSDDSKQRLIFIYSLIISRINRQHELTSNDFSFDKEEEQLLYSHKEYSMAANLLKYFGFKGSNHYEIYHLESMILGLQLTSVSNVYVHSVKKIVRKSAIKVIQNFKKLSGQSINNQNQLLDELSTHLLSTFYRVKYHHQYSEDIATKIKKQYYAIYTYTRLSIRPFELLNNSEKLNENEIALITIYFGAQLLGNDQPSKSILLVCSSGLGTSRLLKVQLEKEFPEII